MDFDAEACCRDMAEWIQEEYERMRKEQFEQQIIKDTTKRLEAMKGA